jgi:hypothetical protein
MSSISNVNSNSSVINVGRTTPVSPGAQTADKSIPVVMASDQTAIPVVEQNKVQSEVALSLLGIPRAEVALGIFADVNTYDVNPSEWSMKPAYHQTGDGVKHLPTEAGALVEASRNKVSVLTSKRFFRYQPGRVSAATFGIKSSVSIADFARNPAIRKYGIYDKYDGYYWETRNNGEEDNFTVVRRTQSLQYSPVSPYGVAGSTKRRGESNLGSGYATAETITNTQLDDYRIVGLGAAEDAYPEGDFIADRKIITEKRYKFIDEVLDSLPVNTTTVNVSQGLSAGTISNIAQDQGSFYANFAKAYNEAIGSPYGKILTADEIKAKCKRDLDYWIDNFLLDLKWGGDAHTRWNTTNFGISSGVQGSWIVGSPVGVFPNITRFERVIHERILHHFQSSFATNYPDGPVNHPAIEIFTGLSDEAKTKLDSLQDIVLAAFTNSPTGDPTTFAPQVPDGSNSIVINYGNRNPLGTFYDVKRNFWSYYATTKKQAIPVYEAEAGKTYMIKSVGDTPTSYTVFSGIALDDGTNQDVFISDSANVFAGRVFSTQPVADFTAITDQTLEAELVELITYTVPTTGTSSPGATSSQLAVFVGLTDAEQQTIIKDKCQRDVGYIVDGYKNDITGGGDAETTYNMRMFVRGTGMSVYSQRDADGSLTEPERHTVVKNTITKDLKAFGASEVVRNRQTALADRVITNFTMEDQKQMTVGSNPFPGNLIVQRDGLLHVHAGVYDPSLLKDSKQILCDVTAGVKDISEAGKVGSKFKLTEGNFTFGQHVKITWSGSNNTETFQDGDGVDAVTLTKGEVLRVQKVLGPKGNECTLVKADGTGMPNFNDRPLLVTLDSANLTSMVNVYIDTVVPFIFPRDYDIFGTLNNPTAGYTSEIATTAQTTTNYALVSTEGNDDQQKQREFKSYSSGTDTISMPLGAMFPYMYAFEDNLKDPDLTIDASDLSAGFVNTALDPTGPEGSNGNVDVIRSQIDNVNFYPEYVNWIKNNVKPEYWGVYEYRVPRSRFSHDALDGKLALGDQLGMSLPRTGSRFRVYSDVATGPQGTVRPGEIYSNPDGAQGNQESLYKFDFTKVTMLKIEFSWYGAVGALFLAYVPVDNGEARWVRVHHLRASNQLKIASLGNATLPITYTTYGGGDVKSFGDGETYLSEYGDSNSHNIVKYGASYYIDGGDRGTVRLYSHNNQDTVSARGKRFAVDAPNYNTTTTITGESSSTPSMKVTEKYIVGSLAGSPGTITNAGVVTGTGFTVQSGDIVRITDADNSALQSGDYVVDDQETVSGTEFTLISLNTVSGNDLTVFTGITFQIVKVIDPTFYIGARVKTSSLLDQNIEVVWAEGERVFLSGTLNSNNDVALLPDRSATVYGVETKKSIKSTREGNVVRNRVQVYPTKMSTANIGNNTARLRFKKTPIFQTHITPDSTLTINGDYIINNANDPITITESANGYLQNDQSIFGWFRGRIVSETVTVFGRLYKEAEQYYFELLESFEGQVTLTNGTQFLPDLKFQADGTDVAFSVTNTKVTEEKEGLSSVEIASNSIVPIAGTGVNVATTYLKTGTEQFDLSPYFDYNKEYLSFPLTDIADSLYFAVDSDTASTNTDEISLGVTWEEQ